MTHEVYLQMVLLAGLWISPIFLLAGFRYEFISADLMHCVCLGIVQYMLGNILLELCFGEEMNGLITKPQEVLGDMMVMLRLASKQLKLKKCPIGTLTLGMIRAEGKPPKLKTKAAEGRRLVPVLRWVLENLFKQDTPHKELRYKCLMHLDELYKSMDVPDDKFDAKLTSSHGRRHVLLYAELGVEALERQSHQTQGWISYKFYPKHHMTVHCVEEQVLNSGNPRHNWCYMDEDAIGKAVDVAEQLHASTLHKSVVTRHRL